MKSNKTVIIIIGAILVAAFFMPWIKFFVSVSAWDLVFGQESRSIDTPFRFVAALIPIAGILIIYGAAFKNENYPVPRQLLFLAPLLTLIIIVIKIWSELGGGGGNMRSSDFNNITEAIGIGAWLTVIGSLILPFLSQQPSMISTVPTPPAASPDNIAAAEPASENQHTAQTISQPNNTRPQVNINLPKVNWNETGTSIKTFLLKYKIGLLISLAVLISFIVVYNLFIKDDPAKDGKKFAKIYCDCTEKFNKLNEATVQTFVDGFDSKKYKTRSEARKSLNALMEANQLEYNNCSQQANIKYNEQHADYLAKGGRNVYVFEQTYSSLMQACNNSNIDRSGMQSKVDEKLKIIIDPEPDNEKMKADLLGREIMGWKFSYLNEFESISVIEKTQNGDRIEYNMKLMLVDQANKNKHDAQVYIVYTRSDEGWYLSDITCRSITYDYLITSDSWTQIVPFPNTRWNAENLFNLTWKTYEYGEEYHSGPTKPGITLPNSNSYLMKSEEGRPVIVKFTYTQSL